MHRIIIALVAMAASLLPAAAGLGQSATPPNKNPTPAPIVFVCEHGNVKSLIAASLFNKAATERGSPLRAISRGVNPEPGVPDKIAAALRADGVDVSGFEPRALTKADIAGASRVVAIGVDPTVLHLPVGTPVQRWDDVPPASVDYAGARAVLQRHIDALLDDASRKP
jgi:hypothetical protein